jgi:hypothetical protein
MLRVLRSACLFAVLAAGMSTSAYAQAIDNATYFTFSQPVTLPGVTLPAGKYVFRILDTTGSRRIIQVTDPAGRHYGTMMSMPIQSDHVPSKPEVHFIEGMEGTVPALRAWWYPGSSTGYEFVYPREQAMRLAERARTPAVTTTDTVSSAGEDKPVSESIDDDPGYVDVPPALPPFLDGAAGLTPWLGAMSIAMGTLAHRGPQLRM